MGERRLDARARLERYSRRTGDDVWGAFVRLRERHKSAGASVADAWEEALAAFPAEKYPADEVIELPLGAGPESRRSAAAPGHGDTDSQVLPGPASSSPDLAEIDWDGLLGEMDAESTLGSVFDGAGIVDFRVQFEWVLENIDRLDIKAHDAPSAGAWALLRQCRSDATFRKDMYKQALSKLMPDRKALESERRFYDDGRTMLDFIERIRQESVDAKYECAGVA